MRPLAIIVGVAGCGPGPSLADHGPQVQLGGIVLAAVDGDAAAPPPGDPRWAPLQEGVSLQRNSVFWLRAPVEVVASSEPAHPLGVAIAMLASYELSWDGVVIARSGRVGTSRADEVPGPIDGVFALPPASPGPHLLTLRISNFHYEHNLSNSFYRLELGSYHDLITGAVRARFAPMLALGWLVVAAVLFLLVYFAQGRRRSTLIFAITCVLVAAALLGQSWRWIVGYAYDAHLTRLRFVTAVTFGASVLLPIGFAYELGTRRRWSVVAASLGLAVAALVVPDGYNLRAAWMFEAAVAISLVVAAASAVRRQRGALPALAGLALCIAPAVAAPDRYHDAGFFAGFSVLLVALLLIAGMRVVDDRRAAARATLRSARLELELVKRGIQPHFLMNALTSILEWIEQEPAHAARFVEALAEELQLLSRVAGERAIPLELELALCRAHVALMSQRLELPIALRTSGDIAPHRVPPAMLHTLVENALTHGRFPEGAVELALDVEVAGAVVRYRLLSPEIEPCAATGEGTGMRYVRARLQESYGDRWRLRAGPCPAGWETVIETEREPEREPKREIEAPCGS